MDTGRGQFLLSLRQGLERTQPGRPGGNSRGCRKKKAARDGRRRRSRSESSKPAPPPPPVVCCPAPPWSLPASCSRVNYFKRLPPEVILKIFSYLDAASLFSVCFVSRQFHELANDNVIWYELYSCEMGRRKWKLDSESADVQDVPAAVWKKLLFSEMGCHKDAVWMKKLRHMNLNTGMPEQTEQVLRSLRVVWEITLTLKRGKQSVYKQSQAFFSDSSVTVCWSGGVWPRIQNVYNVQLHGVLGSPTTITAKPAWRSLISKTLVRRMEKWRYIGEDSLVKLVQFDEGITVGVWRGTWIIAFIMATLHFHRLVERSVLGSLFCPYRPRAFPALHIDVPPGFSVHGYTVLLLLHNSVRRILQCRYSPVLCTRDKQHGEFVQLRPVHITQKHTPISGRISFPWKAGKLQGDIKNCCMMTVSVLDEAQRPVWCISSSAALFLRHSRVVCETYDGEQLALSYDDTDGKLKMTLVWMQDLQLYFLIGLHIWISVEKMNTHFHKVVQDHF
ncbi:F-box only protein 15 [Hemibagrus wyckioides]|uniref:F-box only protein 15 n=1 Tax=Hemibagrus wyckioides TaxID=337641 RepID=UPI00266BAA93|nr:F-box only protein 15 [Hemibagrus wyckioides]XP_058270027.1 F-box only protein 15 [Hemibagrus wyckioides]